jgi:hypothetical protein
MRDRTPDQQAQLRSFRFQVIAAATCPKCNAPKGSNCTRQNSTRRFSNHMERVIASGVSPYAVHRGKA